MAIRPEKIRLEPGEAENRDRADENAIINRLAGEVVDMNYLGDASIFKVRLKSGFILRVLQANTSRQAADAIRNGQRVTMAFSSRDCTVLEQ